MDYYADEWDFEDYWDAEDDDEWYYSFLASEWFALDQAYANEIPCEPEIVYAQDGVLAWEIPF